MKLLAKTTILYSVNSLNYRLRLFNNDMFTKMLIKCPQSFKMLNFEAF